MAVLARTQFPNHTASSPRALRANLRPATIYCGMRVAPTRARSSSLAPFTPSLSFAQQFAKEFAWLSTSARRGWSHAPDRALAAPPTDATRNIACCAAK
jgi:hypothetical protein